MIGCISCILLAYHALVFSDRYVVPMLRIARAGRISGTLGNSLLCNFCNGCIEKDAWKAFRSGGEQSGGISLQMRRPKLDTLLWSAGVVMSILARHLVLSA